MDGVFFPRGGLSVFSDGYGSLVSQGCHFSSLLNQGCHLFPRPFFAVVVVDLHPHLHQSCFFNLLTL